jgi:tyrosyl-DNA phosphodiesterase 2
VKGIECVLITSHLESTAAHFSERQRQLKIAFELMNKVPSDQTVIFGGDLNLRDKEVRIFHLVMFLSYC